MKEPFCKGFLAIGVITFLRTFAHMQEICHLNPFEHGFLTHSGTCLSAGPLPGVSGTNRSVRRFVLLLYSNGNLECSL